MYKNDGWRRPRNEKEDSGLRIRYTGYGKTFQNSKRQPDARRGKKRTASHDDVIHVFLELQPLLTVTLSAVCS